MPRRLPPPPRYPFHWILLFLLVFVPLRYYRLHLKLPAVPWAGLPEPPGPRVDWFLMIRVPEITTQYESGVEIMKVRLGQWLSVLSGAGFHPMLLSDVIRRVDQGTGVPEKTLVILFDPGYRRTYEMVSPIFLQAGVPTVWLTNGLAMSHADRRFVTYHTADQMKDSGLCDVGFSEPSGAFRLESLRGTLALGDAAGPPWTSDAGAFALNRGKDFHHLNFLTVNSAWEADELLHRLLAEAPVAGDPVYLTPGRIQGRDWGITMPGDSVEAARFDLRPPLNRRGLKLFWLSTKACGNFQAHVEAANLVGEFWIQLRVDEAAGRALHVVYSDRQIVVREQQGQEKKTLFRRDHRPLPAGRGFRADLGLVDRRLALSINGERPVLIDALAPPAPDPGMFQIYLTDKIQGTARADGVRILFTPSHQGFPSGRG